jgi:hypothetical protein
MTPLGIAFYMAVGLLIFWLFYMMLKGIIWLGYNGPWPVRLVLAPVLWLILIIGVLCGISLAKDASIWWNDRD